MIIGDTFKFSQGGTIVTESEWNTLLNGGGSSSVSMLQGSNVALSSQSETTFCIDTNGNLRACGYNGNGEFGMGVISPYSSTFHALSTFRANIKSVSSGGFHTVAVDVLGKVFTWGLNTAGQLGDGATNSSRIPLDITQSGSLTSLAVQSIGCGRLFSVALDASGGVHTWGNNTYGQIGNDVRGGANLSIPVAVSSYGSLVGKTITSVSCGMNHTLVIDSTGGLHAWGHNSSAQIGNNPANPMNSGTVSKVPVSVSSFGSLVGKTVVACAAGDFHSLAVDSDGNLHAWGGNYDGQLGTGTNEASYPPSVRVPIAISSFGSLSGKTVTSVSASASSSCAITSDGHVHTWGKNGSGQLGTGTQTDSYSPQDISTNGSLVGKTVTGIVCGKSHMVAVDSVYQLHAWGNNQNGQLGDGTTTDTSSPVESGVEPASIFA